MIIRADFTQHPFNFVNSRAPPAQHQSNRAVLRVVTNRYLMKRGREPFPGNRASYNNFSQLKLLYFCDSLSPSNAQKTYYFKTAFPIASLQMANKGLFQTTDAISWPKSIPHLVTLYSRALATVFTITTCP